MITKSREKQKNESAFTLLELLIVIAIIGLMASVAMVALSNSRADARDVKRVGDVQAVAKALELYFNICNSYPQLPIATINFRFNGNLSLYSGSSSNCGNNQGFSGSGGIGGTTSGNSLISKMPTAPTPADNGSLAVGSRCSEANNATNSQNWNDYNYISFEANQY